jgi:hypothetical protein
VLRLDASGLAAQVRETVATLDLAPRAVTGSVA